MNANKINCKTCIDYSEWKPNKVKNMDEKELYREATDKFGIQAQYIKTMEECAELIKAVAKKDITNMAEEIADVRIMCEQLEMYWNLEEMVQKVRENKLKRLSDMLKDITYLK